MAASRIQISSLPNGTVLQPGTFLPASAATGMVYTHDPNSTLWGGANAPVAISVFAAESGGTVLSQPITANSNGQFPGWVAGAQDVDIVATYKGVSAPVGQLEPVISSATGGGGAVTSVFGRSGVVAAASGDYAVGQVTGAAPLASPTFTGTPAAPTAISTTNTTQIATTAFVQAVVGSAAALPVVTLESQGAVGDGITDDTAAFQACAKLGAVRITGSHSNYKVTTPINLFTDSTHNAQGSVWDMWGITVTTTSTTDAIFSDRPQDGTSFRSRITFLGGHYVGSGIGVWGSGMIFRSFLTLNQWRDVRIIGGEFEQFTASAATFRGCGRVHVIDTTIHDLTAAGGFNAWNFLDSINSSVVTGLGLEGQFVCANNIVYSGTTGLPTAPFAAIATEGNYASFDVMISNNDCVGSFNTGIFNEINSFSAGAGDSILSRVIISDNIIINTNTSASATCMAIVDDGGTPFNDPLKLDQHLISGNLMLCASNATNNAGQAVLNLQASRSRVTGNVMLATGTNGRCLLFKSATDSTTTMSDVVIDGNIIQQTNASATSNIIDIWRVQNWSLTGGRIKSQSTVAANTGHGVNVDTSATKGFIGGGIIIDSPLGNGINLVTMTDINIDGFTIRNANATNNAAGNNSNGITMVNAPAGALNAIHNGTIIDDRGTHQCQLALCLAATPTTKPSLKNVTVQGMASSPFNGSSVLNWGEISGCTFDNMAGAQGSGFNALAVTAGASVFTTTVLPYDAQLILKTVGGMTAYTYSRNSIALPIVAGSTVTIRRGESVVMTWATTAPTYALVPMP